MAQGSLGYMTIDGADGEIRGASLVVDFRGVPMDFRYTDPIRPTKLERILYGNALDVYLREELILQSLLNAVETRPSLWICGDLDLLQPLRNVGKVRAAYLTHSAHAPLDAVGHTESAGEAGSFLLQADAISAPLRIVFAPESRQDEMNGAVNILVEAAQSMELMEPFGRIQKALGSLIE